MSAVEPMILVYDIVSNLLLGLLLAHSVCSIGIFTNDTRRKAIRVP